MTVQLTITPHHTPDPNVIKFVTNRTLNPGVPKAFYDAQSAQADPVARDFFAIQGVAGLFIINEFCTVNKAPSAAWEALTPKIECTIRSHWGD